MPAYDHSDQFSRNCEYSTRIFYKAVNNLSFTRTKALPAPRQPVRSTRSSSRIVLILLSQVGLLLINAHLSYLRAAHGTSCPLS